MKMSLVRRVAKLAAVALLFLSPAGIWAKSLTDSVRTGNSSGNRFKQFQTAATVSGPKELDASADLYEYEGEELFARAILHENDHLDGLIYTRLVTDPPEGYKEEELEYTEPEDDTEEEK